MSRWGRTAWPVLHGVERSDVDGELCRDRRAALPRARWDARATGQCAGAVRRGSTWRAGLVKIAVVGAGISGLTAAYLLNRGHDVELFERNDYAGGHANTVTIDAGDRPVGLDTGFIVYNEHTYPGFTKLLATLGVRTKAGDMSISVRCTACRMEYSSRGLGGMLADRTNLLRPRRWLLGVDILRFYRDTRRAIASGAYDGATIDEFVREKGYGGEFVRHFLLPLASAVWSTPASEIGAFPVPYFLRFLSNHGIIGLQPAFVWRTVAGGSQSYVRAMTETFAHDVRLSAPVRGVKREGDGVTVCLENGESRAFDHVVLGCHADEALRLLGDASDDERAALGGVLIHRESGGTAHRCVDAAAQTCGAGVVELRDGRLPSRRRCSGDDVRSEPAAGA